ncbi:MAG: hypothetical protein CSA54_04930 [Gammaproteobacteria bacterium]|nr:MAG: hypothetical protein CSA54_04930 [Gammaproteobacteria bacterium]
MQSIYRFRDAEVMLFERARTKGIGPVVLESLQLQVNFRSSPDIIEWVNTQFPAIFPTRTDVETAAVPYAPSTAFREIPGEVRLHPFAGGTVAQEAAAVADLCRVALDERPQESIAILLRSRAQAGPVVAALRDAGLPYRSVDMDVLGERPVVRDIVALTLALRYPHDRLHWLAVLRSPAVGLTLADLTVFCRDPQDGRRAIPAQFADAERIAGMSKDGRARLARFRAVADEARQRASRDALMPWVESVWLGIGGPAACRGPDGAVSAVDLDAAERAFQCLGALEAAGRLWRQSVIEAAMAELYAGIAVDDVEQAGGIQIMTLHKSKGLEFDTVILPSLDRRPKNDTTGLINWFERSSDDDYRLLLAPLERPGRDLRDADRLSRLIRKIRERRSLEETRRLLYVACTRARRSLHLLARLEYNAQGDALKSPVGSSLLAPLRSVFEPLFEARCAAAASEAEVVATASATAKRDDDAPDRFTEDSVPEHDGVTNTHPVAAPPLRRLPADWTMPVMAAFRPSRDDSAAPLDRKPPPLWGGRDGRDIGTVVHRQLQLLADGMAREGVLTDSGKAVACVRAWIESEHPDWLVPLERGAEQAHPLAAKLRRELQAEGMPMSRMNAALVQVWKAVHNTLEDDVGCWILAPHAEARSEWALSIAEASAAGHAPRAANYIIDRSFVDDGQRWIIDYKTGEHEGSDLAGFLDTQFERYRPQLENYADIIGRVDSRPVMLGLYFPLHAEWKAWQPGRA